MSKNKTGKLDMDEYILATSLTQIVSIDLLVCDGNGKYLLGKRRNPPAQNSLFVPGGRAYKGEMLSTARDRIINQELGYYSSQVTFKGVYEHYYPGESPGGVGDIDTHYVSLAFDVIINNLNWNQFDEQHSEAVWYTPEEIRNKEDVHILTRYFFQENAPNKFV